MPYVIPAAQPAPGASAYLGDALGNVSDLLLQAILSGMVTGKPTGGTYSAPSGASTTISPAERVATGQPQAGMRLAELLQQQQPGRFTGTGFGGLQVQPNLSRQLQQVQLQKAQQDLDPNSPINRLLNAQTAQLGQTAYLQQIEDDALAGDEDAAAAYRYLKKLGAL